MKYPKRVSEILTQDEIRAENIVRYGSADPWANNKTMQDHIDQLTFVREAIIAKALGIDFDEVCFNGDNAFYKKHIDRFPDMPKVDYEKLVEKRNDPQRYLNSYMWGYDQTNVEIAEWIGSFNGLQVFIRMVGKFHTIFFARPKNKDHYDYPVVKENSSIKYPLNPKTYEEARAHYEKHDDNFNGYYR